MNKKYFIEAPAKLNLNLTIKKMSNNSLHFLESDICFLELTDTIFFQFSNEDNFVQDISNKIINRVKGVNRVVYDISSKPPATIEWE